MAKLTFFPLGNADCCLIDLDNGKKLLFDYAATRDPSDDKDLRIDLPARLREDLDAAHRTSYDMVAFSHLDKDHYQGASDFFHLRHAKKYQDGNRIKIDIMWVPAAIITEDGVEDAEGKIVQAEARYRLKEKSGIRVFSRPDRLKKWLEKNGLTLDDVRHLITDAGRTAPEFGINEDGVEFFIHSPFAKRLNETTLEDRNEDSLVLQATFRCNRVDTKAILAADTPHEALADIVNITKAKGNEDRLQWDIVKLPHHCSYLSLGPDKGKDKTTPVDEVKWLYEDQGRDASIIISTSKPIPTKGTEEDRDDNPPHRQAAAYYRDVQNNHNGDFIVTMEYPDESSPKPLIIEMTAGGKTKSSGMLVAASTQFRPVTPRQKERGYA